MYDIRVIRRNKNALVNYINALHIFRKNLERPLFTNYWCGKFLLVLILIHH